MLLLTYSRHVNMLISKLIKKQHFPLDRAGIQEKSPFWKYRKDRKFKGSLTFLSKLIVILQKLH